MSINETKVIMTNKTLFTYRFSWLHLTRPMTFTGTLSPILAGSILAAKKGPFHFDRFFIFTIASLLVQASVNMLNDYFDFQNGQDFEKWVISEAAKPRTGPRHNAIPFVVSGMLFIALAMGVWLAIQSNFWILAAGASGVLFGYFYSAGTRSLSSLGLGEVTAAIFLGLMPANLAYIIQGNSLDLHIFSLSLPFAFLISSMILSNNIRDLKKDEDFRHTLVIRLGRAKAAHILTLILLTAYLWVCLLIYLKIVPLSVGIIIFSIPLAIQLCYSLRPGASRTEEISGMNWAAKHYWAFGLLFALGLWLTG